MQIRGFQRSDYDAAISLWNSVHLTIKDVDALPEIEKFVARTPELFLIGEEDGKVIGTVIGAWDGRRGWIYHLAVTPEFQGRGLGRQLMEQIEQRLKSCGASQINLLVEPGNAEVKSFYERLGYSAGKRILLIKKLP